MSLSNFFLLISLILIFSCGAESEDDSIVIGQTDVCISISNNLANDYLIYDVYINAGETILCGFNQHNSAIDIFSLESRSYLKSYKIPISGPNSINDVIGFKMIGKDTVVVITLHKIFLFDLDHQQVINSIAFAHLKGKYSISSYDFFYENNGKVVMDSDSTILIMAGYRPLYTGESKLHLARYNLNDQSIRNINIQLPNWISARNHFGGLNTIQFSQYESNIIYNYPFSDSMYIYDVNTTKTSIKLKLDSPYLSEFTTKFNGEVTMRNIINQSSASDYYMRVNSLGSGLDTFYRFTILSDIDNTVSPYKTYLEFYKSNNILGEVENCSLCTTRSFVKEDSVYVFNRGENENQLCFRVYSL